MVLFTITLVRHGETDENKKRIIQGQQDTELSIKGVKQAQLTGQRLQYERFSHAYSSDLKRAYKTCELILQENKFSTCNIIKDIRIRERKFGTFEGKSSDAFMEEVRKAKSNNARFIPSGGESAKQVKHRAKEFFSELCNSMMKQIKDKEGNTSDNGSRPLQVIRQRGNGSFSSVGSEVFLPNESPPGNSPSGNNNSHVDLTPGAEMHTNSGSTSSTSGYSSGGTDSCEQLSPLEPVSQTQQPVAAIASAFQEFSSGMDMADNDNAGSRKVKFGCPNVSLSPINEHHLGSIPSISSGRGSFDDTDAVVSSVLHPDVLVVSHGGFIKELIHFLTEELSCEFPMGMESLTMTPYNTSVSKFTIEIVDSKPHHAHCILLNDKDHLFGLDWEPLKKTPEV